MESMKKPQISLILNNIRSVYNVGSLFRTADAAGVSHMYIVGYTPEPVDRFGREREDLHKTALGAEKTVPWSYHASLPELVNTLHQQEVSVTGIEQAENSVSYTEIPLDDSVALVLGNEVDGLQPDELAVCDVIAEIPQIGTKESLNVSVAGAIVTYDLVRRSRDAML